MIPLYFDPGTGALIVQFLAAFAAGFVLFYKKIILIVKSFFGIKKDNQNDFFDDIDSKEDDK